MRRDTPKHNCVGRTQFEHKISDCLHHMCTSIENKMWITTMQKHTHTHLKVIFVCRLSLIDCLLPLGETCFLNHNVRIAVQMSRDDCEC